MTDHRAMVARVIGQHAQRRHVCLCGEVAPAGDGTPPMPIIGLDGRDFTTYVKLPKYRVGVRVNVLELDLTPDKEQSIAEAVDRSIGRLYGRVVRIAADSPAPVEWDYGDPTYDDNERLATWLIAQGEALLRSIGKAS